jgi:hypothetical protein
LRYCNLDDSAIAKTAKRDWRKVAIARATGDRTPVRRDWIAERLSLKSAGNVSRRVRQCGLRPDGERLKRERSRNKKLRKF